MIGAALVGGFKLEMAAVEGRIPSVLLEAPSSDSETPSVRCAAALMEELDRAVVVVVVVGAEVVIFEDGKGGGKSKEVRDCNAPEAAEATRCCGCCCCEDGGPATS